MPRLRLISLETLLEMKLNEDKFHLIEALDPEDFAEGHLPGAINIPADQDLTADDYAAKAAAAGLKEKDVIITYCRDYECGASTRAARGLLSAGFTEVYDFKAGKKGWTDAGLELEK